ncbi:MAG: ATP-binding protein [Chloroflexi bacterium]|nr:ATP-binding protein [Chloroflexota bacterium]
MGLSRIVTIETRLEELNRLTEAVENLGEEDNWSPALVGKVNLVLEELAINTINHGHDGGLHKISFTFSSTEDSLTIEMVDDGKPFDPLTDAPVPDVNAPMEERPIGGLGVFLVRKLMDELTYRREEGRNHLTLVAYRAE